MKRVVLLLVISSLISCTKEKISDSIIGNWALTEINSGSGSSILLYGNELSVEFKSEGKFDILGPKSNYTFLRDFNQYELLGSYRIRFFNTITKEELFANYSVNKNLSLSYELRCPYEEKFIRR
jgi:hypothetical protein